MAAEAANALKEELSTDDCEVEPTDAALWSLRSFQQQTPESEIWVVVPENKARDSRTWRFEDGTLMAASCAPS